MEIKETVYLGLGSNVGTFDQSARTIQRACALIECIPLVQILRVSSLYRTTPVSSTPQRDFINGACALETTLSPEVLYDALHRIEVLLGKTPKAKNAPRSIDIDILFFGRRLCRTAELCIPHPQWRERLFVLKPLSDLADEIAVPLNESEECQLINLKEFLQTFSNPHNEVISKTVE
ncbi:MAG TPA: 2-amino-4-hydroxy-6-hydroxymethyldihydropteridine diphosphokinase [Rhabdochlamydiaceae bacterium]|jgi:2-amino-4-hydroxy-6-hydroxymethyldihydropteridine diphosphokinase